MAIGFYFSYSMHPHSFDRKL